VRIHLKIIPCIVVVAIAAIIISLSGCGGGSESLIATIYGTVRHDGNSQTLQDIRVTTDTKETWTDVNGDWALVVDNGQGTQVYVLGEGYEVESIPVSAGQGQICVGTTYLRPVILAGFGIITGIVADAGERVVGAQVSVGGNTAITRDDGTYRLYNVPQGYQTVVASTGTKSGMASTYVISQRTSTANIAISDSPPPGPL